MEVQTDSERVRTRPEARPRDARLVGRPLDRRPAAPDGSLAAYMERYGADPARFGPAAAPHGGRASAMPLSRATITPPDRPCAATVAQPVKVDNDLYVRDYAKCILCYKCVEACGDDAQHTFAIAVAGRGFDARISTEWNVALPGLGLRLLRQLHRRLSDRRAHVQARARHARRGHLGRGRPGRDRHDLPVLRRRLHRSPCGPRTTASSG